MNAGNGRGRPGDDRAGDDPGALDGVDAADLWVRDPQTGSYHLRAPESGIPSQSGPVEDRGGFRPGGAGASGGTPAGRPARSRQVDTGADPPPSRRRATSSGRSRTAAASEGGRGGRKGTKGRKRLKWTAISLVGVLLLIVGGAYGYYQYLNGRIKTTQKNAGSTQPESAPDEFGRRPLNILLIGSDSRIGAGNEGYGDNGHAGLADTTILMHVSADRSNATLVSIPRDTMVHVPRCVVDGKSFPEVQSMAFNETLTHGGPPCTVSTVDEMLGVQVDHYIMIDFNGVKEMTKAVGGVDVCLNAPINDPIRPNHGGGTGLFRPAGMNHFEGEDALKFLRARHAFGDGSDLARIEAQKGFLMALSRQVKANASLTNPAGMLKIAQVATGNLTVDNGLNSINKLVSLGNQLKKVPEKRMSFTTLPNEPYPANPTQRVQQAEPYARQLWAAVASDTPLTKGDKPAPNSSAPPAAPPSSSAPPTPLVDPSTVSVYVSNGSGVDGKAAEVADELKHQKFQVPVFRNVRDGQAVQSSVVKYPSGRQDAAVTVAQSIGLPASAVEQDSSRANTLELVIGKDFPSSPTASPGAGPKASGAPTPPAADVLKQQTADQAVCAPKKG